MTELRWLISREFVPGTAAMAVQGPDGRVTHYERMQYRNVREGLVVADRDEIEWLEIPVFSEIPEPRRVQVIDGGRAN